MDIGKAEMNEGFWVFGYGSLMWRPGFVFAERSAAELANHRRSFCLDSVRYRGTPEAPGLVLALEPKAGTRCRGVAYRVEPEHAGASRDYLRQRELVTKSYLEKLLPLRLESCGSEVQALCYVIDQSHPQYRPDLSLDQKAEIIARAHGPAGANAEYLFNTLNDLREMVVEDSEIEQLAARVKSDLGRLRLIASERFQAKWIPVSRPKERKTKIPDQLA